MKTKALINRLSDGALHSGASLATELGVSRTAVWKQVHRAQEKGYPIETLRGQGYRLTEEVDLLDAERIRYRLDKALVERLELVVLETVDSTNAEIVRRRSRAQDGYRSLMVCLADAQTAGRGRRGKVWQSPPGENLYLSFGLTLPGGFSALDGLSLVVGSAVAEALETLGLEDVQLKWPNDIMHKGSKLAGILIELQGELEGAAQVVAGIGLNVHMQHASGVDQAWTSLARIAGGGHGWRRNTIAVHLVEAVIAAVDQFSASGFADFQTQWQARDMFFGEELKAVQGELQGIGCGIDATGNYLIQTINGTETIRAGEISMRVAT